jgi:hypothetical protein
VDTTCSFLLPLEEVPSSFKVIHGDSQNKKPTFLNNLLITKGSEGPYGKGAGQSCIQVLGLHTPSAPTKTHMKNEAFTRTARTIPFVNQNQLLN